MFKYIFDQTSIRASVLDFFFFLTKDEQKVEYKTIFKTQEFTCTCEISYG